ncbi:MAG: response regulator [Betaproteobacteria bacterium]|nr:response regulator [Betaproteobacteria bacterium]
MHAGRRILVVDDNPDAVATLSIALRRAGHEVHHARDGRSAIELARACRPEFIFLDIGLPGMSGHDVARAIRLDATLAGARLIALTGSGQEHDREQALAAGFDQFLVKPIDLAFVESLLGRRR